MLGGTAVLAIILRRGVDPSAPEVAYALCSVACIVMPEPRYEAYRRRTDFIPKTFSQVAFFRRLRHCRNRQGGQQIFGLNPSKTRRSTTPEHLNFGENDSLTVWRTFANWALMTDSSGCGSTIYVIAKPRFANRP